MGTLPKGGWLRIRQPTFVQPTRPALVRRSLVQPESKKLPEI
jgi:hypothetical protein